MTVPPPGGAAAAGADVDQGAVAPDLPAREFASAVAALPLVSVDWVVTNPDGQFLLGRRTNAPARGWWFTPGGRIRKNEPFPEALARIAHLELGVPAAWLNRAVMMGVWDHFYPDSAFDPEVSTHYVNLPRWLPLSWQEIAQLAIRPDAQHSDWVWRDVAVSVADEAVHPYVRPYAAWVVARLANQGLDSRLRGRNCCNKVFNQLLHAREGVGHFFAIEVTVIAANPVCRRKCCGKRRAGSSLKPM